MVRSLSDESEHDGIGRWFDNDDESVQSPQQIPIGEDQDAKEIPVDVGSPKEMLAYLTDFQQKTEEVRLLQPVTDVPSALSVPSLNLSDETISCSCSLRSFRNATGSSAHDETATLEQRGPAMAEYGYDEDAQDAASDTSSERSGSLSPASCPSPSNTNITSPGSDGSYQDSVDSFEDMPESAYEPFPTETSLGSDWAYGSDPETNYPGQHDQPRDAHGDDSGEANESTRQEEPTATETGCTEATETSALVQHKDQPPKRTAGDDENEHQQVSRAKKSKRQEDSHLRLACPFYKHDPIQYRRCHSHVLKRNSYVKQHLFRCHMQPIHCDICLSVWPTVEDLREHRRAQVCERREYIAPDGITPEQERKLRSRLGGPNKSESDQWFDIYSIIFPNSEKPKSAYLNGELSEDAESLREFMEGRGTNLIMEQLVMSGLVMNEDNNSNRETERKFQRSVQNALRTMFEGWQSRRGGAGEDDGGRETKRPKPTPREFPCIKAQAPVRTDTGSTNTTATILEDQLEGDHIGPTTSSPQQT
ncbi:Ammonium transporter 1 [Fusarium coicis]|nr:Ammonium transporter 1 [Fusarium coicis]